MGHGYYTVSEGSHQPIYYYERVPGAGDLDHDGDVDVDDFGILARPNGCLGAGELLVELAQIVLDTGRAISPKLLFDGVKRLRCLTLLFTLGRFPRRLVRFPDRLGRRAFFAILHDPLGRRPGILGGQRLQRVHLLPRLLAHALK